MYDDNNGIGEDVMVNERPQVLQQRLHEVMTKQRLVENVMNFQKWEGDPAPFDKQYDAVLRREERKKMVSDE